MLFRSTLDRSMYGSDQAASLEPSGINRLVRDIRTVDRILGDGVKKIEKNAFFDQKIFFCKKYDHAFLEKILDTNLIYKFYHTKSSNSQGAVLALNGFYSFLKKNSKNLNKYNIVDIGGNDSTFLKMFTNNKEVKVSKKANKLS